MQKAHHYAFVPLLRSDILTADPSHVKIGAAEPFLLQPMLRVDAERRLAHLPRVEDVTKFTRNKCAIESSISAALDIVRVIYSQAATDFINVWAHALNGADAQVMQRDLID